MKARWKRNAVVATMAVLVCAAVALNWRYTSDQAVSQMEQAQSEETGTKILGQATLVSGVEDGADEMCIRDRSGLDQIVEAFGKIKVSNAVVTHCQIQYCVEGNGLDDPGGNIQDQKFDLQLVLNEPMARHARRLRFSVYDFASSIPQSPGVCTPPNQNGK